MNLPYLIADTPRAGSYNQRMIVPVGIDPQEIQQVLRHAERALQQLQGTDYIAVSRKVLQPTTNRTGTEMLLLVNVDVSQLKPDRLQEIKDALQRRLPDLEHLITQRIDWRSEGQDMIVPRLELQQWASDFFMLPCPPKHAAVKKPSRSIGKYVAIIFLLLCVCTFAAWLWQNLRTDTSLTMPAAMDRKQIKAKENYKKLYDNLIKEKLFSKESDVRAWLAAEWNIQPASSEETFLRANQDKLEYFVTLYRNQGPLDVQAFLNFTKYRPPYSDTNEYLEIYEFFKHDNKSLLSIGEFCKDIRELSGKVQEIKKLGSQFEAEAQKLKGNAASFCERITENECNTFFQRIIIESRKQNDFTIKIETNDSYQLLPSMSLEKAETEIKKFLQSLLASLPSKSEQDSFKIGDNDKFISALKKFAQIDYKNLNDDHKEDDKKNLKEHIPQHIYKEYFLPVYDELGGFAKKIQELAQKFKG